MALEKAGINLTLQGEAQYIAGLRNINRETELMALNTKLAVAQLGTGASPTQRFTAQMRSLGSEIEKASTKTLMLRNRNKELPNEIFKTGKSLDVLKDAYEKQVKVQDELKKKKEEVVQTYGYGTQEFYKSRDALKEQNEVTAEAKAEVDKLEKSYNNMLDDFERMPNSMAEAQLATQKLVNEQEKLRKEYLNSGGIFAGFANKLDSGAESLEKYGRNISDLGSSFMGVTGAIVAGGGGALKVFMDWETAFQQTKKTVDEMSESVDGVTYTYDQLERGLRDLSLEIPIASSELAEMGEIAGRLQIPADQVVHFTEVMAKMAVTTDLSSEEAAESFGKFLNITLSGTETTQNLANAIVELGNNTAATESDIIRMGTRWASTGKIIGMTDEQIIGTSATLLSLGVRAEAGGSSLQRAFQKINDAVLDSSDKLTGFAKVAEMGASDFAEAWSNDPVEALVPFLKGLSEIHEEGGNVNGIMRDLGITSVNELNSILVLAQGYEQLADNVGMAGEAYHETNEAQMALNEEARVAFDTTQNKLILAWSRLKDQLIDVGEPVADALLDMVDAAEPVFEMVENMAQSFTNLDEVAQRDLLSTVAKIALIAPALKIVGGAMQRLSTIFELGAGTVRGSGKLITKAMFAMRGETTALTTVASTAAGAKGVGGLATAVSVGLPAALAIGATALGGWTLWKAWGEDAYEASQRTKEWGFNVGEAVAETLGGVKEQTNEVTGLFGLMAEGFSVDSEVMVSSMKEIGETIQDDLNNRLKTTNEYLESLPENLRNSQSEIIQEHQKYLQDTLSLVDENMDKINEVETRASEEKRKLNADELNVIRQYQDEALSEYIGTLGLAVEEEKAIRKALSGDVAKLTEEQAADTYAVFKQQNTDMLHSQQESATELKEMMKEVGINPDSKQGKELLANNERYWEAMKVSSERNMAEILMLFPEMVETIDLMTGEALSKSNPHYQEIVRRNQRIMEDLNKQYGYLAESSREALKTSDLILDQSTRGAKEWNDVVLQSGDSVESFKAELSEATADIHTWNKIRPLVHSADLDSNVKLIMGEVAIEQGRWDGMAWEDKQAVLKDNFSETVYKAIVDEGTWDKLDWKERIAVLNNGFSNNVMQAIIDEGKWKELPWEEKKAILTTNSPKTLKEILEDVDIWNTLPIKIRKLIADGSQINRAVDNAQRKINSLRGKEVTMRTRHESIYTTINRAGNSASSNRFAQSGGHLLYNRGTNYHPGGLAMVNDQQGATFRELVTLPDGSSFVPKGRDVLLNLPKGSQVLRAALTKMKIPNLPQYARGVGSQSAVSKNETIDSSSNDTYNVYITANGDLPDSTIRSMATKIEEEIKNANDRRRASRGERVSFG